MSLAESEFARIMASTGAARMQGLMKLTRTNSQFAPGWAALAEEHWASRRREEALQAAKKALRLDSKLHARFSIELRLASRPLLAEVAPPKPRVKPRGPAPSERAVEAVGARAGQMLDTALKLSDRAERLAVLQDLKEFAPTDPELLFHLAKEQAVLGRSEDARQTGDELRKVSPERYSELYAWASSSLAKEQAVYEGRSGGARPPASAPKPAPQPTPAAARRPEPRPAPAHQPAPARQPGPGPMRPPGPGATRHPEPGGMRRPEPGGMRRPEPGGMRRPEPGGMRRPEPGGMRRPEPAPMRHPEPGGMRRPEPGGMRHPEPGGMRRPEPGGMRHPEPGGMRRPEPAPMRRPEAGGMRHPEPARRPEAGGMRHPESDMRRSEPGPMRRPEPAPVRPSQPPGRMSPREMHAAQPGPHGSSLRPRESDAMTRPIQQQSRPDESARPHLADAHRGHSGGPPVSNSGSPMPSSPRGMAAAPASTLDQVISNLDRNLSARGIEQSPGEREFDEAATVDASLEDLGLSDDEPEHQDEVTMRAKLGAMGNPRQPDGDNETVRLHLSELQKLVSASVDPKLDD